MELLKTTFLKRWVLALSFLVSIASFANAASVQIDGLYYNLTSSSRTAEVTYQNTSTSNYSGKINVVIPERISYAGMVYTVTVISDKAFANCTSLESITIPSTVITIGNTYDYSFDYTLSGNSSYIYYSSGQDLPFFKCTSLKSVRFEDGSEPISLAFSRVNSNGNTSYAKGLFSDCPLEEIYLGRDITYNTTITAGYNKLDISISQYPAVYGYSPFYAKTTLKKITIGESVTSIPLHLFRNCSNVSFVDFGNNIKEIGDYAFSNCKSISSVRLPRTVISIGSYAFSECTNIATLSAPGIIAINNGAFYNNTSLASLELSDVVNSIGSNAFYKTSKLHYISLNDNLKSIGDGAFQESGLYEIIIPNSVNTIGNYCFAGSKLQYAKLGGSDISLGTSIFKGCADLEAVTIESKQTKIPDSCFEDCISLKEINLMEGLQTISDKAFANCTSLERITIPGTVIKIGNTYDYSFDYTLSGSSSYIYSSSGQDLPFFKCTSLKSVRFEDGSEPISLAFSRVNSNGNTSYAKGLFSDCPLEEIYLGRDITYNTTITAGYNKLDISISQYPAVYGYSPFYKQKNLEKITIGETVKSLPSNLFRQCVNLSIIISLCEVPPATGTSVFDYYGAVLYYPNGSTTYTTTSPWSSFKTNYAMKSEGNLMFIPISDTQAMVAKFPGANPESITVPASVISDGKTLNVTKVMDGAFADCKNLTNVTFPSSVTEIGEGAFAKNEKLASITFNGQTIIGKNAFSGCTSIITLTLPSTLEEIRERAFYNIPSLTQVSFGSSLKTIGKEAFASCGSLTAARMPNTLETIESSAFENCVKLTYVSVGDALQNLGNRAFFNCTVLTEIDVPGSTVSIGDQAFENCNNLTLATINSGTKNIGTNCFKNCESLTTISIPGTVTTLGEGAFDNCIMLSSVSFLAGEEDLWIPYFSDCPIRTLRIGRNLKYAYGETGSPFRNKSSITRLSFTGNYVTTLYNNLFDGCSGITSITLPSSLKRINSYAFHNCTGLNEIEIPDGVSYIGNNSFENCSNLSNISLPSTLTILQEYIFHNCESLAHINLKEGLTTIKTHAFDNCISLEDLIVPGTTTLIEDYNFEGCKSLKELVFKDAETPITLQTSRSLFRDTPLESLFVGRNIDYSYTSPSNVPFYGKELLKEVVFSENENLTTILPYFIYGASSLESLVIPDNITSAGKYAFANCSSVKSIQLSNSLPTIEEGLLQNCSSLKSLVIPSSVGTVDNYALGGCNALTDLRISDSSETMTANIAASSKGMCAETSLENLYIGRNIDYTANSSNGYSPFYGLTTLKNVTFNMNGNISKLGDYYLYNCSAVESLDLPESLTAIGTYSLAGMTSLEYCRMRNNVTSVGAYGFYNDRSLTDLTFSNKVSTLNNNLFDGCSALPKFTIFNAVTSIQNNVFNGCGSLANVNFENGSGSLQIARKYKDSAYSSIFADCPIETLHLGRWLIYEIGDESWSPFYSQTQLMNLSLGETVGDIGKYLFEKCTSLEKVDIPGVESIGEKSFYGCSKLNDVTFNNGTRSLGDYAFSECVALDNVKLPSTVVSISEGCFKDCSALNTVDMGASLEIIGPSAFSGCRNLMNADIPETVYGLGVESFKGCISLPYLNVPKGVSSVGARAFQGCTGAEWLTLSEKCTSLGANSFDGCNALRYIKSYNQNPPVGLPNFAANVIDNGTVFVPEVALDDYMDADIWWEFFTIKPLTNAKFVTYLNLDTKESTLKASQTVKLNAEAGPNDAADTSVGFVSDNNEVATVDATGLVTAVEVGEANIKAYAKDGSGYYQICKITVEPTLVERIDLSDQEMNLRVNRSGQISAEIYPATTTNKEITWSSSNKNVATIDEEGNIKAIYDGVTTLKAEAKDGSGVVATCQLTVLAPMAGDSNDNDAVTITDAVNTANYAVGNEVENFNFRAADVNGDNRITLADASGTVTIILEQPAKSSVALMKAKALIAENNSDFLVMEDFSFKAGQSVSVPVMLDNTVEYVALQADVIVPEGMKIESVTIGNRAESNHSLITKRIDAKTVRVVLFDLNNSEFADNNEPVFNINVISDGIRQGEIIIGNIIASDAEAHEYSLYSTGGNFSDLTGVGNANISNIRIEPANNSINIFNAENYEVTVFATDGTTIARFVAKTNIETINVVQGIYVVAAGDNAVKVIVK